MAKISGATNEKIFSLTAFRGLNQSPDGDTKLKMGEAAISRNFRVTRDGNLQRRPGTKTLVDLETDEPIKGLWTGFVNGHEYMLGACDGKLYKFWDDVSNEFKAVPIGRTSGSFSGPVASFETDGEYPITALSVGVEPKQDLHGYDSPWPAGGGTNMGYFPPVTNASSSSVAFSIVDGEKLKAKGTASETATAYAVNQSTDYNLMPLGPYPAGTYTVIARGFVGSNASDRIVCTVIDSGGTTVVDSQRISGNLGVIPDGTGRAVTFTASNPWKIGFYVSVQIGTTIDCEATLQLQSGSSASTWTPYSNECPISGWDAVSIWNKPTHDTSANPTATIQIGQTVYGGTLDVTGGKMMVDRAILLLRSNVPRYATQVLGNGYERIYYRFSLIGIQQPAKGGLFSHGVYLENYTQESGHFYTTSTDFIVFLPTDGQTVAYLDAQEQAGRPVQICYPLATPIEITLTPTQIATLVGQNNVWSDAGDVTVETDVSQTRVNTDNDVHIFGFSGIAYIMDGQSYKQWDGTTLKDVDGYRPLVYIAIPPAPSADESTTFENVNRLTNKRRIWISPDGSGTKFMFPESGVTAIDYVMDQRTGDDLPDTEYSLGEDAETGENFITFNSAPPQAVNSFEIGYSVGTDYRTQVTSMQYAELFAGQQDTRVFLYGDGSNRCIYSGIDYNGIPRADYFPDLYECRVGDENTPITGMIRHYSALVCYKSTSTWMISATSLTLVDNLNIPAFYVSPVNRNIGNAAPGQVRLVLNSPYAIFGNDLYEWKNSSYYTSNLTSDERQAKRISDRIWYSLKGYDMATCYCYDDNDAQEYYVCSGDEALVYNYAADAWSRYTAFPVSCMTNLHGELYIGAPDGRLKHFSYGWMSDDGAAISAYWESGSMAFGQDYMRKYAAQLWVGIKPESRSEVWVTVATDKKNLDTEKVVSTGLFSFANADFANWTFNVSRRPKMKRLKLKAKKFVFYKLIFKCTSATATATILAADIRVRMTGYAK